MGHGDGAAEITGAKLVVAESALRAPLADKSALLGKARGDDSQAGSAVGTTVHGQETHRRTPRCERAGGG